MINKYIDFIISQIIHDSQYVQYEYGWNFLIIPYCYWLMFFFFKYIILTLPIWVPINLVLTPLVNTITATIRKTK